MLKLLRIWDKVFKNGPSKIVEDSLSKIWSDYGLLKQTISLQLFQRLSSKNSTWSILEYFVRYEKELSKLVRQWNIQSPFKHLRWQSSFAKIVHAQMAFTIFAKKEDVLLGSKYASMNYTTSICIGNVKEAHRNTIKWKSFNILQ